MERYTKDNIEDWDFRRWQSILNRDPTDPFASEYWKADRFLSENFTFVFLVEHLRLAKLKSMLDSDYAMLSDDKMDVLLTDFGVAVLGHTSSWRDTFTRMGRLNRRITKALVREWEKNGRLRLTILPLDMEKQFPGLSG